MNCRDCQNQIFDGQLDRNGVVHLAKCADCLVLDREVRLNGAALAELREELVPVRIPRQRWPWVAGAAVAAAIVAVIVWPSAAVPPAPKAPLAVLEPPPVAPAMPEVAVAKAVSTPRHVRPVRAKPAVTAEPLMVKFFTNDPDVVIYWLIDPPKGEIGL
jgi:hypothetical protein